MGAKMPASNEGKPCIPWEKRETFFHLKTRWLELVGTRWLDSQGEVLEYWCTRGSDSVIVIPRMGNALLLPAPTFRPGVERCTWDFPGGRLEREEEPIARAREILQKELGVKPGVIRSLIPLTRTPLLVNSSTSSQRLYGYWAELDPDASSEQLLPHASFACTHEGFSELLRLLECLQCRALLLEYLYHDRTDPRHDAR